MYRHIVILACVLVAATANLIAESTLDNLKVDIIAVENIEDYLKKNPDLKAIELNKEFIRNGPKATIRHTLGRRVAGDRLVASGSQRYSYPTLQDIQLQLTYPVSGIGAILTYVEVYVEQSSTIGNAYVVAGGIGQRTIRVLVQAKSTYYFNYQAQFYGY